MSRVISFQFISFHSLYILPGTNISPQKGTFEDAFPFPQVGYVSSLEGIDFFFSEVAASSETLGRNRCESTVAGKKETWLPGWFCWVAKNVAAKWFLE